MCWKDPPPPEWVTAEQTNPSAGRNGDLTVAAVERVDVHTLRVTVAVSGASIYRDMSFRLRIKAAALSCELRAAKEQRLAAVAAQNNGGSDHDDYGKISIESEFITFNRFDSFLPPGVFEKTLDTSVGVGAVGAIFSSGSPMGLLALQRSQAVALLTACGESSDDGVADESPQDMLTNPLQLKFGGNTKMYSRGAIVGNWVVVAGAGVVSAAIALLLDLWRGGGSGKLFSYRSLGKTFFPGLMFTFLSTLADGIISGSLTVMTVKPHEDADVALGSVSLAIFACFTYFFASRLLPPGTFFTRVVERATDEPAALAVRDTDPVRRKMWRGFLRKFWTPYEWVGADAEEKRAHFVERFGSCFDGRRRFFYLADIVELLLTVGIAAATTIGHYSSPDGCNVVTIVIAALIGLCFVVAVQNSFSKPFENFISIGAATVIIVQCAVSVVFVYVIDPSDGVAVDRMNKIGQLLQFLLIVFSLAAESLKAAVNIFEIVSDNAPTLLRRLLGTRDPLKRRKATAEERAEFALMLSSSKAASGRFVTASAGAGVDRLLVAPLLNEFGTLAQTPPQEQQDTDTTAVTIESDAAPELRRTRSQIRRDPQV